MLCSVFPARGFTTGKGKAPSLDYCVFLRLQVISIILTSRLWMVREARPLLFNVTAVTGLLLSLFLVQASRCLVRSDTKVHVGGGTEYNHPSNPEIPPYFRDWALHILTFLCLEYRLLQLEHPH
jgi:hypothetical protein